MKRARLALLIAVLAGCARFRPASPPPDWMGKTVFADDHFIYAVGHSQPQDTEKTARHDAVADAAEAFIKHCGVTDESFDRSVESYSLDGEGRERDYSRLAARAERRPRAFARHAPPMSWYSVRDGSQHIASVLLRIPKEEQTRIQKEKDVELAVDVLLYHDDDDGKLRPLIEGETLRSGGGVAVYARPSDESFVYLYEIDAGDRAFRLFPNPAFGTGGNPLAPGKPAWIPNGRGLLTLDNTTGKERLYLFASRERIPELEGGAAALTRRDLDDLVAVNKMSVDRLREKIDAVPVRPPQKTTDVLTARNKLQAQGAVVYETWFKHR